MISPRAAYPTPPQGPPFGHFDQKHDHHSAHSAASSQPHAHTTHYSSKYSDASIHSQTPPATPVLNSPGRLSACRDEFPSNPIAGSYNPLLHNPTQELFPPIQQPATQRPSQYQLPNLFPNPPKAERPSLPGFKSFCEASLPPHQDFYVSSTDTKWTTAFYEYGQDVRMSPQDMLREEYGSPQRQTEAHPPQSPRQFYSRQQILSHKDAVSPPTPSPATLVFPTSPSTPIAGRPRHRKVNSETNQDEVPKKRRRVAPRPLDENGEPRKRVADDDFEAIQDFSPSIESLTPAELSALKTTWSESAPLDLSADPHLHLLHPAEKELASTLRLSCARYLTCKRRIFLASQERHSVGKKFNKTDAQQACKIDVNKASRLWQAFSDAGLFDV